MDNLVSNHNYVKIDNSDILLPQFNLKNDFFLSKIYQINSFKDAIHWIHHNSSNSIYTKLRIMNCALDVFWAFKYIDHKLIKFYLNVIHAKWITDIYKHLYKHLHVNDQNEVTLTKNQSQPKMTHCDLRINYLKSRLLTMEELTLFLNQYFQKKNKPNVTDFNSDIKKKFVIYLESKISTIVGVS